MLPGIRWVPAAVGAGLCAGLGAAALHAGTQSLAALVLGPGAPDCAGEPPWFSRTAATPLALLAVLPAVGGALGGWVVRRFAPETEGAGTNEVVRAVNESDGAMRARVPFAKLLGTTLLLGFGGSGGRGGPVTQIGAGLAALVARGFRIEGRGRAVLVAAGLGAGLGALFRAPIAGAFFAAEVLRGNGRPERDVVLPALAAAGTGWAVFAAIFGGAPLYGPVPGLEVGPGLLALLPLALFCGGLGRLWSGAVHAIGSLFRKLPWRFEARTALGALCGGLVAAGVVALTGDAAARSLFSSGMGAVQAAIDRDAGAGAGFFLLIALSKLLASGCTVGSGAPGGVFGPALYIGGCGGIALGSLLHSWLPAAVPHPAAFAVLGMGGVLAAAARTPLAGALFAAELVRQPALFLPGLAVAGLAYVVARGDTLYRAQRSAIPA